MWTVIKTKFAATRKRLVKSRCLTFIVPSAVHTILPKRLPFIVFFSFSEQKTSQVTFRRQSHLLFVFKFSPRIKQVQLQLEKIPTATLHKSPWALRGPRCSKITRRNLHCIHVCMPLSFLQKSVKSLTEICSK